MASLAGATALSIAGCSDQAQLPVGTANGTYSNRCCGEIRLLNGRMSVAGQQVDYVVDQDKLGTFVLPTHYVGASPRGFVLRPDQFPLKMRLDSTVQPSSIELIDHVGGQVFAFRKADPA